MFYFLQEWSSEGYQLWMVKRHDPGGNGNMNGECEIEDSVIQWGFVKSALTVNPCMVSSCWKTNYVHFTVVLITKLIYNQNLQ